MVGESNLDILLRNMQPVMHDEEYVFCSVKAIPAGILPLCTFQEVEGITLILQRQHAVAANLEYNFLSKMITLNIHSDLNAVGFLAKITECLAASGISVNAISAYYHDHLFVPIERADETFKLLQNFGGAE